MKNLRIIFFVLVLVNLVFLAWSQAYFVFGKEEIHEPQRMSQQVNADKFRILANAAEDAGTAAAAHPADKENAPAQACLAIGGLTAAEAEKIALNISMASGHAVRLPAQDYHRVLIPDLAGMAQAEAQKAVVLAKQPQPPAPLSAVQIQATEKGKFAVLLGVFKDEAAARAFVAALARQGISNARWIKPVADLAHEGVELHASGTVLDDAVKAALLASPGAWLMHCAG
ncbi:MAG: SPOR domain-containing protein [Rugosibacter sp.]